MKYDMYHCSKSAISTSINSIDKSPKFQFTNYLLHNEYEITDIFYINCMFFSSQCLTSALLSIALEREELGIVITLALSNLLLSILYI